MTLGQINQTVVGDPWQNQVNSFRAQCGCGKAQGTDLNKEIGKLLISAGELLKTVSSLIGQINCQPPVASQPAPVQPPAPQQSCHPAGSLKVNCGVVTTPGGYKIEQLGQFEWKVTGPDGKSTRVWGDPHVDEGDGGKWDFKRDSTFVLGDGTRINVTTAPWGNDMTVTKQLEIISGNDRVLVTDIDKGKGKVGQVTQDGFANVNSFGKKDVFVMGRETDDWSFQGKEIIGSNNGGESFKLGNALAPLVQQTNNFGGGLGWANALFNTITKVLDSTSSTQSAPQRPASDPRGRGRLTSEDIGNLLKAVGGIFTSLAQVINLSNQISFGRVNQNLMS